MARFFKKREESRGLAPGQLVFIGERATEEVQIRMIDYDEERLEEVELQEIQRTDALDSKSVTWVNINGLHETEVIRELGGAFGLHPLLLEDILDTGQRPKTEEYENVIFLLVKMLRYDKAEHVVIAEQLSIVLGPTFLVTFQERPGDVFEPVRNRIRHSQGRIRMSGVDYLAFALLDTVVDNYVEIVERLGAEIEDVELEVLGDPNPELLRKISRLKREVAFMRKSIRPAREAIAQLAKVDSALIRRDTVPFLKELLDHINQATEGTDTYREMLSDALNTYNSVVSNRMNDIMKVLTIFSAIFIPLTFIAGIYGTNFDYLPELKYRYSYFIFWGVMATVAAGMLYFFRRRRWI